MEPGGLIVELRSCQLNGDLHQEEHKSQYSCPLRSRFYLFIHEFRLFCKR